LAEDANRDHFVAIQIETLGAADQADQIAKLDGVDLLFIGPNDLSQALGVLGQPNHEKVWAAIEHVAAAARRHGKHWGIVPFDPPCAQRCVELGCRMLTFGNDVSALRLGIAAHKQAYARHFEI
jgi:2-keto-3-deoxy-L-rhamnonate aldolase RhmA